MTDRELLEALYHEMQDMIGDMQDMKDLIQTVDRKVTIADIKSKIA